MHRGPMTVEQALALLRPQAGTLLDPSVVEAMVAVQPEWEHRRASEPELKGFVVPELDVEEVTV